MFKIEITGDQETLNITPEELNTICRLCLNKNGAVMLFERSFKEIGGNLNELLSYLSLLQVDEDDGLPQKICNTCATLINEFFFFKEQINASQVVLQIALGKVKIKNKITNINLNKKNVNIDKTKEMINDINELKIENSEIELNTIQNYDINELKVENSDIELNTMENCDYINDYVQESIEESPENTKQNLKEIPGYVCKSCGEIFDERKEFLKHRKKESYKKRKIIANSRRVPCNVCKKMIVRDRFEDHMNTHTNTKPYVCEICGKSFHSIQNLYTHKVTHREKKPHICKMCGKGFNQSNRLEDHIRLHKNEKLICHICGVGIWTMNAFSQHQKKHLMKTDYAVNPNRIGRKISHTKKRTCDICKKEFATNQRLVQHMCTHTGERPLKCSLCDTRFVQVGSLNCHMRIHTGEKPYQCNYCGKRFTLNGNLQQHIKTHTGERPYSCDICKKSFYTNSSLKKHKKIHDRIKTYC